MQAWHLVTYSFFFISNTFILIITAISPIFVFGSNLKGFKNLNRVLLNRAPTSTQLHPSPPSSFQPPPIWANLGQKSQSCLFCLKVSIHGISRMLILISTFFFLISTWKSIFGQIWAKKAKFVHFAWKLAHLVSLGCGFLFQDQFSEF